MSDYQIEIKDQKLNVQIVRRKVKNINLRVTPQKEIFVSANPGIPIALIEEYLERKAEWIYRKVLYFEQFSFYGYENTYESGETFLYLGKQYRIKVILEKQNNAKLIGKYLQVHVTDKNNRNLKKQVVESWYIEKSNAYMEKIVLRLFPKLKKYGYEMPELKIKVMKTRWGSYSAKTNTINVNSELIKTAKSCVEYILLHELVHLRFQKHDRDFYNFLTVLMPDWKKRKELLELHIIG